MLGLQAWVTKAVFVFYPSRLLGQTQAHWRKSNSVVFLMILDCLEGFTYFQREGEQGGQRLAAKGKAWDTKRAAFTICDRGRDPKRNGVHVVYLTFQHKTGSEQSTLLRPVIKKVTP